MWENRITLDYIKHNDARNKIQEILNNNGLSDECISDLNISTDSGYVIYEIICSNGIVFSVFDDGNLIK